MASEQAKELRKQGIAAAKAGQKDQARQLLQQSLRIEPGNEAAWLWLTSVARDQRERLFYLAKLLEINPNNEMALQSLQQLGITREQLMEQVGGKAPAQSAAQPSAPPQAPPAPVVPGVPTPDPQRIAQIQNEIDAIVREYLAPASFPGVTWTQKSRQRAGERDILYLRAYIGAGVAAALIVLVVIGVVAVNTNPDLRAAVFAPTTTFTFTPAPPTLTPTPTPGVTPTPSPTPELTYTPSPTVPPEIPNGQLSAPQPTEIYPPVVDRAIRDSINLLDRQDYDAAVPTLQAEVTRVASSFNPAPYYYQALALAGKGDLDGALKVLQDAQRRLPEKPNENYASLVNAGLAYVDMLRAQKVVETGQRGQTLNSLLLNIENEANAAIKDDPRLELPYLALARRYTLERSYDKALAALDKGLAVPQLASSTIFIVEKGEIYFQQKEYDRANYQAFLALYINPAAEPAHLLQIRSALAQGNAGLAVLYSQAYLFYYPGSAKGYQLLGDARIAEGNNDLALEAYNQALAGGDDPDILAARAHLYTQQRRFDLARDDLTKALTVKNDPAIQAERMQAAFNAGSFSTAESDADALLGKGVIPDTQIKLLQARITIDQAAASGQGDYQGALSILNNLGTTLDPNLQPIANEYRARAQYNLNLYDDALKSINAALLAGETGSRHYLRGLIFEAQGQKDFALRDYDWVVTWSAIYPYSFLPDARKRLDGLKASS